jgi:serine/threonine protein phosphatase PrpC
MEPGSTLAMCTDGLVESRRRDIDEGISLLRTALGYEYGSLENACDALLQLLPDRTDGDDVTLMLARMEGR